MEQPCTKKLEFFTHLEQVNQKLKNKVSNILQKMNLKNSKLG